MFFVMKLTTYSVRILRKCDYNMSIYIVGLDQNGKKRSKIEGFYIIVLE